MTIMGLSQSRPFPLPSHLILYSIPLAFYAPAQQNIFSVSHICRPLSWIGLCTCRSFHLEQLSAFSWHGRLPLTVWSSQGRPLLAVQSAFTPSLPRSLHPCCSFRAVAVGVCLCSVSTQIVNSWRQRPCLFYSPMCDQYLQHVVKYPIKCFFFFLLKKCDWILS